MSDLTRVGRVLRASTRDFTVGCQTLEEEIPSFGTLVRVERRGGLVYGLITDVRVDDDPFVRQLIAAGSLTDEYVADQRQRRQVPVEVHALVVGGRQDGGGIYHRLPPQPPATLSWVELCGPDEIRQFGGGFGFLRTLLNAEDVPADELLAASLRQMAAVQDGPVETQEFLIAAGRELARLLSRDPGRLDGILQRMRSEG
ncbi:MAG: hypothetical protein U9R25_09325 [Chloroflexota bacterium]|nr:hypothetical protein [Chloroflexota bacterium]